MNSVPGLAAPVDTARLRTLYFAAPISSYRTARYTKLRDIVFKHRPDALIVSARDLYLNSADWRRRWPLYLPLLDALVFIHDGAGYIGRGTHQEIEDMQAWGKPVQLLDDWGRMHPLSSVKLALIGDGANWQQYARVTVAKARSA